ncbi:hypothetical protein B0H15DRAFT_952559, partial [Mycena belliarum]
MPSEIDPRHQLRSASKMKETAESSASLPVKTTVQGKDTGEELPVQGETPVPSAPTTHSKGKAKEDGLPAQGEAPAPGKNYPDDPIYAKDYPPHLIQFTRVPTEAPSWRSSAGSPPPLQSVTPTTESEASDVHSASPEETETLSFEELVERYKVLANAMARGAQRQRGSQESPLNESHVDVASATPSFSSLVNPAPSQNSAPRSSGSSTTTDKKKRGLLESESISQALRAGREPARIFISYGRNVEVYDEGLAESVTRYHPLYNPLEDDDPLLEFGAVDGMMSGKTSEQTMQLRDV